MGAIEERAKKRRRRGAFQLGVLLAVGAVGLVVVAAAMPNVVQLLKYLPGQKKGARFNYRAKTAFGRLLATGLIVFVEKDGRRYARITEEGKRILALERARMNEPHKRRWDHRWRVVLFDIPERRRSIRDRLREFMSAAGFVKLQNSAWIYPYDCEDVITLAKAEFKLGKDVLYLVVDELENDRSLREHFSLPLVS